VGKDLDNLSRSSLIGTINTNEKKKRKEKKRRKRNKKNVHQTIVPNPSMIK